MKKIVAIALLTLIAAACVPKQKQDTPADGNGSYTTPLTVGKKKILVEIASSDEAMAKGLSGRAPLSDEQGMLFVFGDPTTPAFWMPDMRFNIDIVWIRNNTVIGIAKDVPAPDRSADTTSLPRYYPPAPVDMVLEVPSGWTDRSNIVIGDTVTGK